MIFLNYDFFIVIKEKTFLEFYRAHRYHKIHSTHLNVLVINNFNIIEVGLL